jgi:hypothetical protein
MRTSSGRSGWGGAGTFSFIALSAIWCGVAASPLPPLLRGFCCGVVASPVPTLPLLLLRRLSPLIALRSSGDRLPLALNAASSASSRLTRRAIACSSRIGSTA